MDAQEILERIIETGECPIGVCKECPIGKISADVGCWVMLSIIYPNTPISEAYKIKALDILTSIMVERMVGGTSYETQPSRYRPDKKI